MIRLRILASIGGLLLAAPLALGGQEVEAVSHVAIPVAQIDRAVSFYEALGFVRQDEGAAWALRAWSMLKCVSAASRSC